MFINENVLRRIAALERIVERLAVSTTPPRGLHLRSFGARGDGVANDHPAFVAAIAAAESLGGAIIYGEPTAVYKLGVDDEPLSAPSLEIVGSNITLDGQGATITSSISTEFLVGQEPALAGDYTGATENVVLRNWTCGLSDSATELFKPIRMRWCVGGGVHNVVKRGQTGTAFTVSFCRRVHFSNVWNYYSRQSSGAIGFLSHINEDCVFERCYVLDGPFGYAFQNKGGRNNLYTACAVRNVQAAGLVVPSIGFRDRGNAPFSAAHANVQHLVYPYPTGDWLTADVQRASWNAVFEDCVVEDSAVAAFIAQEAFGTHFNRCRATNVLSGVVVKRSSSVTQARLTAAAAAGATSITVAMELVDGDEAITYAPWLAAQPISILLETLETHSTTASGDQVDGVIPLTAAIPAGRSAEVGADVGRGANGAERDYTITDFRCNGTTLGNGIAIAGYAASYLPGVKVVGGRVENCKKYGLYAIYTDGVLVDHLDAYNNNRSVNPGTGVVSATGLYRGIQFVSSTYPKVLSCDGSDDQTPTHTQQRGIAFDLATVTLPTMRGCRGEGNTLSRFLAGVAGNYGDNVPGEASGVTTDATLTDTFWRLTILDGQLVRIDARVLARQTNGAGWAEYELAGVFSCTGTTVTAHSNVTTTVFETNASWNAIFTLAAGEVRIRVNGNVGFELNWTMQVRTVLAS